MKKHSFLLGTFYMVLSAIFFSFAYLFAKIGLGEIEFFLLIFFRFLIPLVLLSILFLAKGRSLKTQNLRAHLLRGFFVVGGQYSIFYYLSQTSLLNATLLLNTSPIFIPLIEWLFLGHRIPKSTWISTAIGGVGVVLVLQPGRELFTLISFLGLLAGFSQASSQVIYGLNARRESIEANLFYLYLSGSFYSLIPLFFIAWKYPTISLQLTWTMEVLGILFLLSVTNIFNQYFRGKAYGQKKPSTLSSFLYFSVVLSGLLGWFVFKEEPNLLTILGSCLIILGGASKVYLRYFFLKRKKKTI